MIRSTAGRPSAAGLLGIVSSLVVGASFGVSSGCYAERPPPPTYRYQCDADGDCNDGEDCRGGICERRCTLASFEEDCGSAYAACFNGACSSVCEVDADVCPSAQDCVDLSDLGVDLSGGGGGFGGGGGGSAIGICGRMCNADNDLCPSGETCVVGFCTATCDPTADAPCTNGLVCIAPGICAPDLGGTGDAGPAAEDGSTGASGGSTGGSSGGESG